MVSTQTLTPIEDIVNDLVFLKNGAVSLVIETSAVNFGLLFETEQAAIIESFAGLLNSLSFPIQIVILSRRLDVSSYLNVIDRAYTKQANPLLKQLIVKYRQFVENVIEEREVLDKRFFVCLTVSPLELGILAKDIAERSKKAYTILMPRSDHIIRQLTRLGLKSRQLTNSELVRFFYSTYNPTLENPVNSDQPTQQTTEQAAKQVVATPNKPSVPLAQNPTAVKIVPPQPQNQPTINTAVNQIIPVTPPALRLSRISPQPQIIQPPPAVQNIPVNPTPMRIDNSITPPTSGIQNSAMRYYQTMQKGSTFATKSTHPFVVEELTDDIRPQ